MLFSDIEDHVIIISAASSAMGMRCTQLALARGAKVILTDKSATALAELARQNDTSARSISYIVADIDHTADLLRVVEHALAEHGRIDAWVSSAGIGLLRTFQSARLVWLWLRAFPVMLDYFDFSHALDRAPVFAKAS